MKTLLIAVAVVLVISVGPASADTYIVDPSGGGDFVDLRVAWYATGGGDTLLLVPGTYEAESGASGWPLRLNGDDPALVSQAGAGQTEISGDGSVTCFRLVSDSVVHLEGIAFRGFAELLNNDPLSGTGMTLTFIDNIIEDCGSNYALNACWCNSWSVIRGNLITGNSGSGIYMYHYFGVIEDNEICFNARGAVGNCCEEPTIHRNHIHHNVGTGVRSAFCADIADNVIEYNGGYAIASSATGSSTVIENNILRFNGGGIVLNMYSSLQFHHNDVYGNEPYNVECSVYVSGAEFDATMNWWGTTDPDAIAAGIFDCNDDPEVETCVIFDPWCMGPGCEPTVVGPTTWGGIKSLYR
jgi:hypothetical protein